MPQPFPRPGAAQPPAPAAPPASRRRLAARPAAGPEAPTETTLGLPIYPAAQFIGSYDAGRGQRYYIFGSAAPFTDLVAYYRTTLKQKGEIVFESPATYSFEVGKYREETMAFPPGVTIKDFQSARLGRLPESQTGRSAGAVPHHHSIRPGYREVGESHDVRRRDANSARGFLALSGG